MKRIYVVGTADTKGEELAYLAAAVEAAGGEVIRVDVGTRAPGVPIDISATAVAALQTVGAVLVVAMLVTPGATAYLLTDRFGKMIGIAVTLGVCTSLVGAYASYFFDGSTGGCIVTLQSVIFMIALFFAPKHGMLAARAKRRAASMA